MSLPIDGALGFDSVCAAATLAIDHGGEDARTPQILLKDECRRCLPTGVRRALTSKKSEV